jgi:Endosomal/lysosomal potassium channel TMEM175
MEKSRIAALVDGIFAVAMTLLVLDLKLPEGVKMSSDAEVWRHTPGTDRPLFNIYFELHRFRHFLDRSPFAISFRTKS